MEKVLKTKEVRIAVFVLLFLYVLFSTRFCYNLGKTHNIVD